MAQTVDLPLPSLPEKDICIIISLDYKSVISGYASIENGVVVEIDGNNDVAIPSYEVLRGAFNFDESNLKNVILGENSFEADIVSPMRFYGTYIAIDDLKVKVEYTQSSLKQLIIFYNTANAAVKTVYSFTE